MHESKAKDTVHLQPAIGKLVTDFEVTQTPQK